MKEHWITINLPREEAERLSLGLSDVSCWIAGFKAATPEAYERHPMNADTLTTLNIKIKQALAAAERKEP